MKSATKLLAIASAVALSAGAAWSQGCNLEGSGSVRILANDFTPVRLVIERATECASDTIEFSDNQTSEHKEIQVAALTTNPATYSVAIVANGSLVPLLNEGLVRPLDDLVEKYGDGLSERQFIRVDGKIMAVAFMANAQHYMYRKDILEANDIEPPTSYEDVIAAADKLRAAGVMDTPILGNFKTGWHMGQEFVNMYLGHGGEFFEAGTAIPAIQNEKGIATLHMLKALTERMSSDYATFDTTVNSASWKGGEGALWSLWGSAVAPIIDEQGEVPEIAANSVPIGALTVAGNDFAASTLWWDGFTIATNISDEEAELAFRAMVHGVDPELAQIAPTAAAWLMDGYQPTPAAKGVFETVGLRAKPYPMLPYMGLLHTALGANLGEYLQGQETAEQALEDVVAAYMTAAREGGFVE